MKTIRLVLVVVTIDEFNAIQEQGPFQFDGSKEGTAIEKLQEFVSKLDQK